MKISKWLTHLLTNVPHGYDIHYNFDIYCPGALWNITCRFKNEILQDIFPSCKIYIYKYIYIYIYIYTGPKLGHHCNCRWHGATPSAGTVQNFVGYWWFGISFLSRWRIQMAEEILGNVSSTSRPWFNIRITFYQYRKSHCGFKTVIKLSSLHSGISYIGKMTSLYWIRVMVIKWLTWCSAWAWLNHLTHCGLLMPYRNMDLGQHWLR